MWHQFIPCIPNFNTLMYHSFTTYRKRSVHEQALFLAEHPELERRGEQQMSLFPDADIGDEEVLGFQEFLVQLKHTNMLIINVNV
jgi:hypothetical protein